MKVSFAADALREPAAFRHLTAIFWLCVDGLHQWGVDDEAQVLDSPWYKNEGGRLQREIAALVRLARRSQQPARVCVGATVQAVQQLRGTWRLPAPLAERCLRTPAIALVENARVDGEFLRLICLTVGARALRRLLGDDGFSRLRGEWVGPTGDGRLLSVRHGGGNNTATQLKLLVEAAEAPPPRVLVMLDSDRGSAAAPLGSTASQVLQTAAQVLPSGFDGEPFEPFVLSKREVENYLPHDAIHTLRAGPIADPDFEDLKKSFGDRLAAQVFDSPQARGHLHERGLRERCGQAGRELDQLVTQLCKLL